jgi:hypothetical protein
MQAYRPRRSLHAATAAARPFWLVALGLALASLAAPATAQRVSLTPQIGFYIPTEKLAELAAGTGSSEIEAGPSFGGRLGLWFGSRLGVEASGSYVPTTFRFAQGAESVTSQDAKLFVGSGQAILFLLPRTGLLSVYLSGGVGLVSRGGVAFTGATDKTDVAGAVGAGAGLNLGGIALSLGVDLLGYSTAAQAPTSTAPDLRQRDVHLKFGLGMPFGGAGRHTMGLRSRGRP